MAENSIISLCYVSDKNDKTTRMCRVADYISGRFVPYVYDTSRDFFGEERDILIGQNYDVLAEIGEIAVFNWYAYKNGDNQWWTSVKRNNEIPSIMKYNQNENNYNLYDLINPFDNKMKF